MIKFVISLIPLFFTFTDGVILVLQVDKFELGKTIVVRLASRVNDTAKGSNPSRVEAFMLAGSSQYFNCVLFVFPLNQEAENFP